MMTQIFSTVCAGNVMTTIPMPAAEDAASQDSDGLAPATRAAFALLETLVARGLEWVVVCPGARSQALALAAATLEREGALRIVVCIDERSGAFTALGIGCETGRPAAVVTTSGTAVANMHPAVLEAHHAGVPLIVLTADRPEELRGIGSNQTTVQSGIFGASVRWHRDVPAPIEGAEAAAEAIAHGNDAWSAAMGGPPAVGVRSGPVHLNLAYREPLASARRPSPIDPTALATVSAPSADNLPVVTELSRGPRTLVIAGADAGAAAELLAHEGGWPLLAEVSSGSRFGRNLVPHYRAALADDELVAGIERIVVFGHPTLGRQIPALIAQSHDVHTIVVRSGGEDFNPGKRVSQFVDQLVVGDGDLDPEWLSSWLRVGNEALQNYEAELSVTTPAARAPRMAQGRAQNTEDRRDFANAELAAVRTPLTRELLVDGVWRATWPHDRLVWGASRLIRVADRVVSGKKISVVANRGLAGIDGTISTATGIALASGALTRVVVGDLTFLHDVGGLWHEAGQSLPRLQIIVGNDRGGTIFDTLEVAQTADPTDIERVLLTPHDVRLSALAEAYGFDYRLVTTVGERDQALLSATDQPLVIEVPLERA
jgi:2-succinyl-5-enolpyruvyl-6-hydroxy-3-cyclohexene-1-carboxylate synthase